MSIFITGLSQGTQVEVKQTIHRITKMYLNFTILNTKYILITENIKFKYFLHYIDNMEKTEATITRLLNNEIKREGNLKMGRKIKLWLATLIDNDLANKIKENIFDAISKEDYNEHFWEMVEQIYCEVKIQDGNYTES
jgi:6-pyruvoyl-tetrahydropterin synthase